MNKKSFYSRLQKLGNEAHDAIVKKLKTMPGQSFTFGEDDKPEPLYINDCTEDNNIYILHPKTVRLNGDAIEVFADGVTPESIEEENGCYPDEYWCWGGEWICELEGFMDLADSILEA